MPLTAESKIADKSGLATKVAVVDAPSGGYVVVMWPGRTRPCRPVSADFDIGTTAEAVRSTGMTVT